MVVDGNVGIGTTDPKVKLDVNGPVKIGQFSTKPTCNVDTKGSIVFDTINDKPYVCAASGVWKPLDSDGDKDGLIASFDINGDASPLPMNTATASKILSGYTAYSYSGGAKGVWSIITGNYVSEEPETFTLNNYCFYNSAMAVGELPLMSSQVQYSYSCTNYSQESNKPSGSLSVAGWIFSGTHNSDQHSCGKTFFDKLGCSGNILGRFVEFCQLINRDNGSGGANCSTGGVIKQGSLPAGWAR